MKRCSAAGGLVAQRLGGADDRVDPEVGCGVGQGADLLGVDKPVALEVARGRIVGVDGGRGGDDVDHDAHPGTTWVVGGGAAGQPGWWQR